jgi:hypothetical protein
LVILPSPLLRRVFAMKGRSVSAREEKPMIIRTTTDPMTLRDVTPLDLHPSLFEGDKENGLEIHFESEQTL